MSWQVSINGDKHLCVNGNITLDNVDSACQQGKALIDNMQRVVVNLHGLDQTDSSCLAMLIEWIRAAKQQNKNVIFIEVPKSILDLSRVCGLDEVLPIGKELVW